jgi:hypothetical protein
MKQTKLGTSDYLEDWGLEDVSLRPAQMNKKPHLQNNQSKME